MGPGGGGREGMCPGWGLREGGGARAGVDRGSGDGGTRWELIRDGNNAAQGLNDFLVRLSC